MKGVGAHSVAMLRRFLAGEDGAVLTEAIVVIPFLTFVTVGILEFGNIFWQRAQIEVGLRDAGRYLARCRVPTPTYTPNCNEATARNIAFYGRSVPGSAKLRVPGWGPDASDLVISAVDSDGNFKVSTSHTYLNSPLYGFMGIPALTIHASHEQRYMGW